VVRDSPADCQTISQRALDLIVAAGFGGLDLDAVDGFALFEYDPLTGDGHDVPLDPEIGESARPDMIDWLRRLAHHGRAQGGSCPWPFLGTARSADGIRTRW
jgi:hypothetical protein